MAKKKPQQPRTKGGKFGKKKSTKDWADEVAEQFRKENDRTQTEGVREWESSSESDSKAK